VRGGQQKCEFNNGLQTARKKTIEAAKEEMESAVEDIQGYLSRYVEKKKKRNRRKRKKGKRKMGVKKRKERKMKVKKSKNTKGTRLTLLHGVRYAVPPSGFERAIPMFEVSNAFSVLDCETTFGRGIWIIGLHDLQVSFI
jgi:actin-related protein